MGNQQTARTFTEQDLQILVKTSGKSEADIRKWYEDFRQESKNSDRMTKQQFQVFYTKLRDKSHLQEKTDHIFRAFDTDQSGTIEFNEFLLGYIATTESTKRQKLEYAFQVYDINDDQIIDKGEVRKILFLKGRLIGLPEHEARAYSETIMLSFDTDRDKVISKTEFVEGCLHDPSLDHISNPFW